MPCLGTLGFSRDIGNHKLKLNRLPAFPMAHDHPTKSRYTIAPKYINWDRFVNYYYLDDCICNEYGALTGRHLKANPHLSKSEGLYFTLRPEMKAMARLIGKTPRITESQFVNGYGGKKRMKYIRALSNMHANPVIRTDIKAHVKKEKHPLTKYRPARMIQARSPEYNIQVGTYLKPIEHVVYRLKGDGINYPNGPLCAKGHSPIKRAKCVIEALARFNDPAVYEIDHSFFDSSITKEMLELEHFLYLTVTKGNRRALRNILKAQLRNECKTKYGIRYTAIGTRMSGDLNTALGNCVINLAVLNSVFRRFYKTSEYWLYVDGDDSIVITEGQEQLVFPEMFEEFGLTTKVIHKPGCHYTDIEFCQSKILKLEAGYQFVNNPIKIMSTIGDHYKLTMTEPQFLGVRAKLETVINAGVPVIWPYALRMLRQFSVTDKLFEKKANTLDRFYQYKFFISQARSQTITRQSRVDFELAFGIPIGEQLIVENDIRFSLDVDLGEHPRPKFISKELYVDSVANEFIRIPRLLGGAQRQSNSRTNANNRVIEPTMEQIRTKGARRLIGQAERVALPGVRNRRRNRRQRRAVRFAGQQIGRTTNGFVAQNMAPQLIQTTAKQLQNLQLTTGNRIGRRQDQRYRNQALVKNPFYGKMNPIGSIRSLGRTQAGAHFAMAYLHPNNDKEEAVMMPDYYNMPVVPMLLKVDDRVMYASTLFSGTAAQAKAAITPNFDTIIYTFDIPEIAYAYVFKLPDGTLSELAIVRNETFEQYENFFGYPSYNGYLSMADLGYTMQRIVCKGITSRLDASDLSNQGYVHTCQYVNRNKPENITYEIVDTTAQPGGIQHLTSTRQLMNIPTNVSELTKLSTKSCKRPAMAGAYLPHRSYQPMLGYDYVSTGTATVDFADTPTTGTVTTANYTIPQSYLQFQALDDYQASNTDVYQIGIGALQTQQGFTPGAVTPYSFPGANFVHPGVSFQSGMSCTCTYYEGLAGPGASGNSIVPTIQVKVRTYVEAYLGGTGAQTPFMRNPPILDQVALDLVTEAGQMMPDSYPADYNDFGDVMGNIFGFVKKWILPVAKPLVSMIPGVGPTIATVGEGAINQGDAFFNGTMPG